MSQVEHSFGSVRPEPRKEVGEVQFFALRGMHLEGLHGHRVSRCLQTIQYPFPAPIMLLRVGDPWPKLHLGLEVLESRGTVEFRCGSPGGGAAEGKYPEQAGKGRLVQLPIWLMVVSCLTDGA